MRSGATVGAVLAGMPHADQLDRRSSRARRRRRDRRRRRRPRSQYASGHVGDVLASMAARRSPRRRSSRARRRWRARRRRRRHRQHAPLATSATSSPAWAARSLRSPRRGTWPAPRPAAPPRDAHPCGRRAFVTVARWPPADRLVRRAEQDTDGRRPSRRPRAGRRSRSRVRRARRGGAWVADAGRDEIEDLRPARRRLPWREGGTDAAVSAGNRTRGRLHGDPGPMRLGHGSPAGPRGRPPSSAEASGP